MSEVMNEALVWAEIDMKAIAHNVQELRRITAPRAGVMAVVKANAYGHGAIEVARQALRNGADSLGVARLHEGVVLRNAGIEAPILIFGYTPPAETQTLIRYDLTQTACSLDSAKALSESAAAMGKKVRVHIKVDTGMGRIGIRACGPCAGQTHDQLLRRAVGEIESILLLPGLDVEGIYTHFAGADLADKSFAYEQLERFMGLLVRLDRNGITFRYRHAANSAAVMDLPESHLDLVRPGISLYGLYPSRQVDRDKVDLKPAMAVKSRIVQLKEVPAGFTISYGMTYETKSPTTIATVAIGYADGLNRGLSSRGRMLAGGRAVPIVGRVCMDLTMLDVGGVEDLHIWDEVVIFGRQRESSISVDEIASTLDTINYEVVTMIGERMPRVYLS